MANVALFVFGLLSAFMLSAAEETEKYETLQTNVVEQLDGGMRLVHVPKVTYIRKDMHASSSDLQDFEYTKAYAFRSLEAYFDGDNFNDVEMDLTTPLWLKMNVLDHDSTVTASFLIPHKFQKATPAPKSPSYLASVEAKYYFVKTTTATGLRDLMHEAAEMLTDLSYDRLPFDGSEVAFALYNYPPQGEGDEVVVAKPTEIWVERKIVDESHIVA